MFIFNHLTIKSKLQAILLTVSLCSILIVGGLGWNMARTTNQQILFNQLSSIRSVKAQGIESYFKNLHQHIETLSEDRMIVAAMEEFKTAFSALDQQTMPPAWETTIKGYYEKEFLSKLSGRVAGEPTFETYRPINQAAKYLQYQYIANNSHPVGQKDELVDAKDGSEYSKIHAKYHPIFRHIVKEFGYHDLFLIDFQTGDIVYSVAKETDFGISLQRGSYRTGSLAKVVELVRNNPDPRAIQLGDFQPYRPSYMQPSAFIAGPIYDGSRLAGILAVQVPINEIDNIVTGNRNWKQDGLGKTGETYLVGSDQLMRSNSRFLLENPDAYIKQLRSTGLPERTVQLIKELGTSVLLEKVDTQAVEEAIEGITGSKILKDYRDVSVLSSYSPLTIEGLKWGIIAKMDLSEAQQPLYVMLTAISLAAVIIIVSMTFIARAIAYYLVKPIQTLIEASNKSDTAEINLNSDDEFGELAQVFTAMIGDRKQQIQLIEEKDRNNNVLLSSIMPTPVAEQLKQGRVQLADRIPQVTVMVARIIGLGKLPANKDVLEEAQLLNQLIDALDEAAERYKTERLKIVGDRYIAACGLTKPRLDQAKQMVDFALEAMEILNGFNKRYSTRLSLCTAIHTGMVAAGLIGTKKLTYDLWGETMTITYALNAQAQKDSIIISPEVYDRVHEFYDFDKGPQIEVELHGKLATWVLRKKWLQDLIFDLSGGLDTDDLMDDI